MAMKLREAIDKYKIALSNPHCTGQKLGRLEAEIMGMFEMTHAEVTKAFDTYHIVNHYEKEVLHKGDKKNLLFIGKNAIDYQVLSHRLNPNLIGKTISLLDEPMEMNPELNYKVYLD